MRNICGHIGKIRAIAYRGLTGLKAAYLETLAGTNRPYCSLFVLVVKSVHDHLPHPHRECSNTYLEVEGWEDCACESEAEVMGWLFNPKRAELDEMQWHVVQWAENGSIDRHLAVCANPDIALAAYDAAILKWPDKEITCKHGARILREHKGK